MTYEKDIRNSKLIAFIGTFCYVMLVSAFVYIDGNTKEYPKAGERLIQAKGRIYVPRMAGNYLHGC